MSAYRTTGIDDQKLVGRINSEHLSDQFQRELSHTPDKDLLHDNELKLDDIHSASGSGVAALVGVQQPTDNRRTDMLATADVSDDNWLVAAPYTSPAPDTSATAHGFYSAEPYIGRTASPDQDGTSAGTSGSTFERSPSKALTDAYAQPSKIPKLTKPNISAGNLQRQPSRGIASRTATSATLPVTRTRSGAMGPSKAVSPSPIKFKVAKPPVASPPRSISDNGEDGQPAWRAITKAPAPKYTQQTDIALGGPFERSSSTQLLRANSTQLGRANSIQKSRSRSKAAFRPTSAKSAAQSPPVEHLAQQIQLTQEPAIPPPEFQSRIPSAPPLTPFVDAAAPISSNGNGGMLVGGPAQVESQPAQPAQPAALTDATIQQLAAEQAQAEQLADEQQLLHLNGLDQPDREADAEAAGAQKGELHLEQNGDAGVQEPVSPDQVDIGLNSAGGPGNAHADQQQGSQPQQPDDEFVKKKAKYCCCIIM